MGGGASGTPKSSKSAPIILGLIIKTRYDNLRVIVTYDISEDKLTTELRYFKVVFL